MKEVLSLLMIVGLCSFVLLGYPVSFTLAGTALVFALAGMAVGVFDPDFLGVLPHRIYGVMTNEVLIAIPLFIFMGVTLERSKVAEELLETMGRLFGSWRGGLGISVSVVGAMLAASTGIVGATVITMGLISLPTMLRRGYDPRLACGSIAAAGTLGQIIPPSIVLVVLGDQISNAHQEAQRTLGNFSPEPVSVGDLFAGALIPGLALVGLYIFYQIITAFINPKSSPAIPRDESMQTGNMVGRVMHALVAPLVLIVSVLGSILVGIATPTEAAGVGAIGATLLAGHRLAEGKPIPVYTAALCLIGVIILTSFVDMRVTRTNITLTENVASVVALLMCLGIIWGLVVALWRVFRIDTLQQVMRTTARLSTMIFAIIIAAQLFSLVFRGLGGDDMVHKFLTGLPGGVVGAMIVVMALLFVLGFFLDTIEILFVVVPIVGPVLLQFGLDPVWLGIMIAINLQTSFLTPPLGYALFYLRSVAPPEVTTMQIYRGVIPFVILQLMMLVILTYFPEMATWLPKVIFG